MAVSHTYLVHQGMVGMEEGEKMFYDEDKQHMLVARGDTLKAFDFSKSEYYHLIDSKADLVPVNMHTLVETTLI